MASNFNRTYIFDCYCFAFQALSEAIRIVRIPLPEGKFRSPSIRTPLYWAHCERYRYHPRLQLQCATTDIRVVVARAYASCARYEIAPPLKCKGRNPNFKSPAWGKLRSGCVNSFHVTAIISQVDLVNYKCLPRVVISI